MKFEVTLKRPAYEIAEVEIEAPTQEAAERLALDQADTLDWRGGDRLADDAATVIEARVSEEGD